MSDRNASTATTRQCRRCGSAVSKQFIRVFGVDNTVHGCLNCLTRTQLAIGEAAVRGDGEASPERPRWPTSDLP
ncbi:DUF7563 family protein [Halobellus limi]|jgi:hypothetical protein|uniref:Uncharacterized protein n=1 Tax=Halobellus limi TaxID=699433 RepID=A0A1H6BDS6_9EURY|nr:hypothetical protein [Halobellus limi]QCC49299.1 hypothetical protein DV707_16275 [Halobellus limi]SEG58822.1 hypothetical protein SAMN04488133_2782 [Halobellus limi]